nr:hypothetical protein [Candidatus Njordarchaeum guaymaensis]
MTDINALSRSTREGSASDRVADLRGEHVEMRDSVAEPLTTEKAFKLAVDLLHEMGYNCLSEDRIDDFTERIDGVFRRLDNLGDGKSSGYLRILSVYRSGQKIHVELYNFLKGFPADDVEMKEVSECLKKLFEEEQSVKLDIHE